MRGKSDRVIPIIFLLAMLVCIGATFSFNALVIAVALVVFAGYCYLLLLWRRGGSDLPTNAASWTVSILVVIVLFLGAELGYRLFFDGLLKRHIYEDSDYFQMSYTLPNLNERIATSEFDVSYRTNSLGLRDRRELPAKSRDEQRIVVMGDSFVQAAQVALEDTMVFRLEELLRHNLDLGDQLTVINLSRSGWSSTDERQFLRLNIDKFEPNMVVLVSYVGNDIIELMIKQSPREESLGEQLIVAAQRKKNPSHLLRFAGEQLSDRRDWPMGRPNQPFYSQYFRSDEGNVFNKHYSDAIDTAYEAYFADILEMQRVSQARGASFILVLAPTKEQVHDGDLAEVVEYMNLDLTTLELGKPQRLITEFAKAHAIPVIDLLEPLRAASANSRVYFPIDAHWNVQGNHVVAEILADRLPGYLQAVPVH